MFLKAYYVCMLTVFLVNLSVIHNLKILTPIFRSYFLNGSIFEKLFAMKFIFEVLNNFHPKPFFGGGGGNNSVTY
jgi:hypothetical protein